MELWAAQALEHKLNVADDLDPSPFMSAHHMYATIDEIRLAGMPWECLTVSAQEDGPQEENPPTWKTTEYQVWFRNVDHVVAHMLANPDFKNQFDYRPFIYTDSQGQRRWTDFMSANYAWRQSVSSRVVITLYLMPTVWLGQNLCR